MQEIPRTKNQIACVTLPAYIFLPTRISRVSYLIVAPLHRVSRGKPLHSRIHTHTLLFIDNPVLCDAGLADLTVALEVNHAKVYGVGSDCPTTTTSMPPTTTTTVELTSALPPAPLPPTLLLAAAAAASGGNVSFAATLE